MNILIVEPGTPPKVAVIESELSSMQAVVGGLIQAVYPFVEEVALICNEEGKLNTPARMVLPDRGVGACETLEWCKATA